MATTGSKRSHASEISNPITKKAKKTDFRMASQMSHFKVVGSPKRKNYTPRQKLLLQYTETSPQRGKL